MKHSSVFVMVCYLFLRSGSAGAGSSVLSEENNMALERELKMLNKPYVRSFKDKYGVVFDCVDMYNQPALDHPLLKNHKIQISPSSSPDRAVTDPSMAGEAIRSGLPESCPDGTVLIRRTLKQDLARARSPSLQRFRQEKDHSEIPGQHFAQLLLNSEEGSQFQEAGAVLEVDALAVPPGQTSSAQILLVDKSSSRISTVQSGWHVDPEFEGDSQTRFMTYWTADDYNSTGCLNMLCPGFVLLSNTTTPGMLLPAGTVGISISKDQSGNWLVFLNQEIVGYFPKEIINSMSGATQVQMGGLTYAPAGQRSPPMGSGVAPSPGNSSLASKFTQLGVRGAKVAKYWVTKDVSDPAIYNVVMTSSSSTGPEGVSFQYGGPGGA